MNIILSIVLNGLAVWLTSMIVPGVRLDGFLTAIFVAILLSLSNILVKPILLFFSLPATIITFGLFIFVIDALVILLLSSLIPGFHVEGFWIALLFSLILSIIATLLDMLVSSH